MCTDHQIFCSCGAKHASLMFRDDVMPEKVIVKLYCPECSASVEFNRKTMVTDNGWVIEYDIAIAEYYASTREGDVVEMTPEIIFDQGYATWRGVYPGDHTDSMQERAELFALARTDKRRYLQEFKAWGERRMERLQQEGWRKASAL